MSASKIELLKRLIRGDDVIPFSFSSEYTHSKSIEGAMDNISFYVLGPDLKARGLSESNVVDGVKIVDYSGFVDLAADHESVQSWL